MRILVTGVSGFLGSKLADYLFLKKHTVEGIVSSNKSLCNNKIKVHKISLEKGLDICRHINEEFDILIHCAAAHPSVTLDNVKIINDNINSVKNLIKFSETAKIKKIIFCSSIAVYGKIYDGIVKDNSKSYDVSLYGLSKLICERLLLDWAKKSNNKLYNLRLPAIIGKGCHETFIIKLINAYKYNKNIQIEDEKSLFNNIVDVNDLTKWILEIIEQNYSTNSFVLGSSNPVRFKEIINTVEKFYPDKKKQILSINNQIKSFYIDYEEAKKHGFRPSSTLDIINKYLQII